MEPEVVGLFGLSCETLCDVLVNRFSFSRGPDDVLLSFWDIGGMILKLSVKLNDGMRKVAAVLKQNHCPTKYHETSHKNFVRHDRSYRPE